MFRGRTTALYLVSSGIQSSNLPVTGPTIAALSYLPPQKSALEQKSFYSPLEKMNPLVSVKHDKSEWGEGKKGWISRHILSYTKKQCLTLLWHNTIDLQ